LISGRIGRLAQAGQREEAGSREGKAATIPVPGFACRAGPAARRS